MTKLESKLKELGYHKSVQKMIGNKLYFDYAKEYEDFYQIIFISDNRAKISGWHVRVVGYFIDQEQIDNLQIAFNRLQSDVKEMKNDNV